jgi:hypothetical protein
MSKSTWQLIPATTCKAAALAELADADFFEDWGFERV